MTAPIADGVMAATHKLVQQALSGQWQDVPKTIQERRDLLDRISSSARPQDQQWLGALRQAMTESDAAVARMAAVAGGHHPNAAPSLPFPASGGGSGWEQRSSEGATNTDAVSTVMDMLGKGG